MDKLKTLNLNTCIEIKLFPKTENWEYKWGEEISYKHFFTRKVKIERKEGFYMPDEWLWDTYSEMDILKDKSLTIENKTVFIKPHVRIYYGSKDYTDIWFEDEETCLKKYYELINCLNNRLEINKTINSFKIVH